jgi:hypothetical protein
LELPRTSQRVAGTLDKFIGPIATHAEVAIQLGMPLVALLVAATVILQVPKYLQRSTFLLPYGIELGIRTRLARYLWLCQGQIDSVVVINWHPKKSSVFIEIISNLVCFNQEYDGINYTIWSVCLRSSETKIKIAPD